MTQVGTQSRPASVDLRSRLGVIRDQGHRPTCLAFAASAAHESTLALAEYLSVEALHFFASARDALPGEGTTIDAVVTALEFTGQCMESDWPYGAPGLVNTAAIFRRAPSIRESSDPLTFTLDSLATGRVVVIALTLTEAWFSPDCDGRIPSSNSEDESIGGHAVAAIGYDEPRQYVLVRNSWGMEWGDGGYGRLSYESLRQSVREAFAVV